MVQYSSMGDGMQWEAERPLRCRRPGGVPRRRVNGERDALCDALRSSPGVSLDVNGWSRVTDYLWSLSPLSPAGSIKGIGGRFNIGESLDRARGQAFPCLYVAQTVETAYAEYFGESLSNKMGPLTIGELALRRESSFTTFLLNGRLERVLDLREDNSLKQFADIIRQFNISSPTKAIFEAQDYRNAR